MTFEQIHKLKAGPELDALVAEKVMGWTYDKESLVWSVPDDFWTKGEPPAFSTNIAYAWKVVEKVKDGGVFTIQRRMQTQRVGWKVGYYNDEYENCFDVGSCYGDTAPLAICRFALRLHEK